MLHAPIFFQHTPDSNIVFQAMRHTHEIGEAMDGEGLTGFLSGQIRYFRKKAFDYLMPRVTNLVKKHGGHAKWEEAGEDSRNEVWYSIIGDRK